MKKVKTADQLKKEIEKLQAELDSKLEIEKEQNLSSLEKKFNKLLQDSTFQINKHLDVAMKELEAARLLSEQTGIPFKTELVCGFAANSYSPETFKNLKKQYSEIDIAEILYENGIYEFQTGWASKNWNSSSIGC